MSSDGRVRNGAERATFFRCGVTLFRTKNFLGRPQ
jgi:hypothetical protein